MNIDLKRVRYFIKLSTTLNFSSAARALKVSQPALTKAIQRLEQDVGGALIRREGKTTHLTPLGTAMLEQFRELDATANGVAVAARRLVHGDMPQLHIGLMCTIGPEPLTGFLAEYQRQTPKLEIILRDLARSELDQVLLTGAVDVALVGAPVGGEQRFRYIDLYEEPMVVVCGTDHPLASRQSVRIEEVLRQPYVDRLQCEFRDLFLSEARRRDFEPTFAARSDREDWAQSLIRQGLGVAIAPKHSLVVPDLVCVPLIEPTLARKVSVAIPIGREDTETVQAFLKAVRKHNWKQLLAPDRKD